MPWNGNQDTRNVLNQSSSWVRRRGAVEHPPLVPSRIQAGNGFKARRSSTYFSREFNGLREQDYWEEVALYAEEAVKHLIWNHLDLDDLFDEFYFSEFLDSSKWLWRDNTTLQAVIGFSDHVDDLHGNEDIYEDEEDEEDELLYYAAQAMEQDIVECVYDIWYLEVCPLTRNATQINRNRNTHSHYFRLEHR